MKLTFIHPAIGHRAGESYIRTWQMESLPVANLTALTPPCQRASTSSTVMGVPVGRFQLERLKLVVVAEVA